MEQKKKDYPDNTDGGISCPFDRTAGGYGTFEKYSSHRFCGQFPPDYLGNALRACFGLYGCRTFPGAGKISGDRSAVGAYSFYYCGKYHDLRRMVSDCGKRRKDRRFQKMPGSGGRCCGKDGGIVWRDCLFRGALPSCTGGTAGIAGFRDVFPSSVYYGHGGRDGGSSSASGSEESGKRNIKNSTARGMIFPGSAVSVRKSR